MPRLSFTTILVDNMDIALEFYVKVLGFEIIKKDHHYPEFVLLQQDTHPIALHQVKDLTPTESRVILGIEVDNLEYWISELSKQNVKMVHKTPQKFFGGLYAGIYDPTGNMLELIQWDKETWEKYNVK
jgi:catechol 2,3-dioxygenase-like lactoylglutathione lyase family enzyme